MTTTTIQRRTLGIAAPTVLLTAVASALASSPAQAQTFSALPPLSALPTGAALAALAARSVPVELAPATEYTVQDGDTLWDIARAHGTTVAALYQANGLRADSIIHPGQSLSLGGTAPASAPTVPVADAPGSDYTVAAGDTLWSIADRHGIALADLFTANGLSPESIIYPGQTLRLSTPAPASPAPASPAPAAPVPAAVDAYSAPAVVLDDEQTANAVLIIRTGRELSVPARGIAIALATAMVESGLTNVPGGDHDSIGLFQQRPSTGWGTPEQLADPSYAVRTFFTGAAHTNGLLDIPGWEDLDFGAAAQEVQVSAFPGRYDLWQPQAEAWLAALG